MEKGKVLGFEDGKLLISKTFELDPNKDGQPVAGVSLSIWIDVSEIPDEAISLWKKSKEEKAAEAIVK